jgi:hypothetical protein
MTDELETKICTKCHLEKPKIQFYLDSRNQKPRPYCKSCWNKYVSDNNKKNPNAYFKRLKNSKLKQYYGISLVEFTQMLIEQDYLCAICKNHVSNFKNGLGVDHNHETGKIRALLCCNCNTQLGVYENNKNVFELYLKQHTKV